MSVEKHGEISNYVGAEHETRNWGFVGNDCGKWMFCIGADVEIIKKWNVLRGNKENMRFFVHEFYFCRNKRGSEICISRI